jgi:hypothetical protein
MSKFAKDDSYISVLRIRAVYPGSLIRIFSIPDPLQKVFKPPKKFLSSRKYNPGCSSRIQIFYPSRIPDPGVKKAPDPDPQHWYLVRQA